MYGEVIEKYAKICIAFEDLSEKFKKKILMQERSYFIDSILVTIYDKLLDEDEALELLNENFNDSIVEFLEEYRSSANTADISKETRKKLFNLCLNTLYVSYPIQEISFADSLMIYGKSHISINNGFVQCDEPLCRSLRKLKVELYIIDNGNATICTEDSLNDYFGSDENHICIVPEDYMTALAVSELIGMPYWNDFVAYSEKNNIYASKEIQKVYESFVSQVKLMFSISAYRAYRHVCGEVVNILDYKSMSNLFDKTIQLDISYAQYEINDLLGVVQNKYVTANSIKDLDVIKVYNNGKCMFYVYRQDDNKFSEVKDFEAPLFDEASIWEMIRNSPPEEIKTDGESVYISENIRSKFNGKQLVAMENLLRQQQYSIKKQSVGTKQKLTEIIDKVKQSHPERLQNKQEQ